MLRGLTERPNVQSTIILSRKDGSIIRAAGIGLSEERGVSTSAGYQWSQVPGSTSDPEGSERGGASTAEKSEESAENQQGARPVEVLASSIFQFVNNANVLGETLGAASREGPRSNGAFTAGAYGEGTNPANTERSYEEDAESGSSEDEVQLLRLRTKHQEIIIFPDPNYICCVVQRVGKVGNVPNRR
jgi:ribosomal protein L25 (general stress protein Ctc)